MSRYPKNWTDIALKIKEKCDWKCCKCGLQCFKPSDDVSKLSKSERMRKTLTIHHSNYMPEDNREENLIPLCSACHLSFHQGKKGNISIGQLELFSLMN